MTARKKWLLVVGLSALACIGAAFVSAVVIVRSEWFREQVRARIIGEVEQATGGKVDIGGFRFDWRGLRAVIHSFVVHGTEGPAEPPLFSARAVEVGLKIISLFRRDVDVDLLRLEQPRIYFVVYPDGRTNLPRPVMARRRRNAVEEMLALAIGRLIVEDGLVELNAARIPLNFHGEGVTAHLFYNQRGPAYTGRVEIDALRLRPPAGFPLALRVSSSLVIRGNTIQLANARLMTGRSSLRMDSTIRDFAPLRADFHFDADLSLDELAVPLRLPVTERGRVTLAGTGFFAGTNDYGLDARLSGTQIAVRHRDGRLSNIGASSRVRLEPGSVVLDGLNITGLGGGFAGKASVKAPGLLRVEGEVKDLSVEALSRTMKSRLPAWAGRVSGPVTLTGEFSGSGLRAVKASARLAMLAAAGDLPVQGSVEVDYDQAAGLLGLGRSYLATSASRIDFDGGLGRSLRVSLRSGNLNDFLPALAGITEKPLPSFPVALEGGVLQFDGLVTGRLEDLRITGRGSITRFVVEGHRFESLSASVSVSANQAQARAINLAFDGMTLRGDAQIGLRNWRFADDSALAGAISVRDVRIEKLLPRAVSRLAAGGIASGSVSVAGSLGAPEATGRFQVTDPVLYGERFPGARAELRYSRGILEVPSARLETGRSHVQGSGAYMLRSTDWRSGVLRFELSATQLSLSQLARTVRQSAIDGDVAVNLSGEAAIDALKPRLVALKGSLRAREIMLEGKPAGTLDWTAETRDGSLLLRTDGRLAGAEVSGRSVWRLSGNYPAEGEVQFDRLALSSVRPWWEPGTGGAQLPVEAVFGGRITFSGEGLNPERWQARVELPDFQIAPAENGLDADVFRLAGDGPVVFGVDRNGLRIERALIVGKDTNVQASGTIGFGAGNALQLRVRGDVDLAALHNLDPDLTASGNSTLDATIRGRLSEPEVLGRLEFRNGSFYLSNVPNGIDKASGVILFSRDRATIETLTAETGGGRLTFGGFVGFGGPQIVYRLQAEAQQVRVRYPEGVSTTLNAALNLSGTSTNSTLSGDVTVLRSGVSPRVDLAGMLAQSSKPLVTPGTQNKLLRGMLFDVRVRTAPNARLETTLTQDIRAETDLRLRGTPYKPVLLGRISATQGDINFLGARYSINRGDISFLNPVKLEPVVNLDLGTRVMGTEVSITFSGPLDRVNVTYRSDPPLQPGEIIALLAVGRAPSTDPTVTARQAELDQTSLGQLGATTLIGQALAVPVTDRLQRFFGVSRIRIDPRLTGVENNPQTQLTLEQQVSRDVTFTYITNLSRSQEQIVRVEWNINGRWSILAVRDENGLFGIDVLFRKQFR